MGRFFAFRNRVVPGAYGHHVHAYIAEAASAPAKVAVAYLAGASRDGHFHPGHRTWRISQAYRQWLELLETLLSTLGRKCWVYRESPVRSVWTLETTFAIEASPQLDDPHELAAFARGYFDAEGGVPRQGSRFYIQLSQKDRRDLAHLQSMLTQLEIPTGRLHRPSAAMDPDYWRFYVSARGHRLFAEVVGSWHPVKGPILDELRSGKSQTAAARAIAARPR